MRGSGGCGGSYTDATKKRGIEHDMAKKKILIIYATAGIGHMKASIAVKKAFDELAFQDAEVTAVDSLDYTNAFFKWTYLQFYLFMINRTPTLWGLAYYITNNYFVNIFISVFRRFGNRLNSGPLIRFLRSSNFDAVISTHFFASEVIGDLKANGRLDSKLLTVVTDYRFHSWWLAPETDIYVVGSEEARKDLHKWKVADSKIRLLGIPVEPIFTKPVDKNSVLTKYGLKDGVPTILVIGGGFGVGPIEEMVRQIGSLRLPVQIVAVCGKNKTLLGRIELLKGSLNNMIVPLGFVDNVYEFMEVSSMVISKSGGITVSETLSKDVPMIIVNPIIGQETRNAQFIVSNGAALLIRDVGSLGEAVSKALKDPEELGRMKKAIGRIRMPTACYDIARLAHYICGRTDHNE